VWILISFFYVTFNLKEPAIIPCSEGIRPRTEKGIACRLIRGGSDHWDTRYSTLALQKRKGLCSAGMVRHGQGDHRSALRLVLAQPGTDLLNFHSPVSQNQQLLEISPLKLLSSQPHLIVSTSLSPFLRPATTLRCLLRPSCLHSEKHCISGRRGPWRRGRNRHLCSLSAFPS